MGRSKILIAGQLNRDLFQLFGTNTWIYRNTSALIYE